MLLVARSSQLKGVVPTTESSLLYLIGEIGQSVVVSHSVCDAGTQSGSLGRWDFQVKNASTMSACQPVSTGLDKFIIKTNNIAFPVLYKQNPNK